jgi:hypothetical protein
MVMIRCSECGRAISTRASACVGCGAPVKQNLELNWVPAPSMEPAPTGRQIARRALVAGLALLSGIVWAAAINGRPGGNHIAATLAALLVIGGLCGCVVALVQLVAARR